MVSSDEEKEYEEMTQEVEGLINLMHSHMGRFPTQDEVVRFIFADEAERETILSGKSSG